VTAHASRARGELAAVIILLAALLAASALRNGAWQSEFTLWTDALGKSPASLRPYNNIGSALMNRGRCAEAIPYLRKAVELDARREEPHYNLATCYMKAGRLSEAAAEFTEVIRVGGVLRGGHYGQGLMPAAYEARAHAALGNIFATAGDYTGAVRHFNESLALVPDDASTRYNLGLVYKRLGRRDDAVAEFEKVLKYDPYDEGARWNLNVLKREGQAGG